MIKKLFYTISFFLFIIFITNFYFSNENIKKINISRETNQVEKKSLDIDLPILKNDTTNIIVYKNDIENYKKERKNYKFWDLIKR